MLDEEALQEGDTFYTLTLHLAPNRVRQDDVRSDIDSQPAIRPLGRGRTPGIHHEKLGAVAYELPVIVAQELGLLAG